MRFYKDENYIKISGLKQEDAGTYEVEAKLSDEDGKNSFYKFNITIEWNVEIDPKEKA